MLRRFFTLACSLAAVFVIGGVASADEQLPPGGTFVDDNGSIHEPSIEALYAVGVIRGCDDRGIFVCPNAPITRAQMAGFLQRTLGFPWPTRDYFTDDDASKFENAINRIAEQGIVQGCNPPDNTRFCPDRALTREEMATILARAYPDLMPETADDRFVDDDTSIHEANINLIAAAGITKGCNPPDNTNYCPRRSVTRGEMATFLVRAQLELAPITPPPALPHERVSRFTTYFDCCENRVTNIRLMARTLDGYVVMPGETFSIDEVVGRRTTAKGYLPAPYLLDGHSECCAIGGGVSQFGTTIHNAVFWGGFQIDTFRPHTAWISRYPLGIEHTLVYSLIDFRFTNDTEAPVWIETSSTSTSVTVELWGYQGGWRMSGYHPRGYRSSSISILDWGGPEAKRVSASVTGSAPGTVKIVRTLTQNGVATSQTWWWKYVG